MAGQMKYMTLYVEVYTDDSDADVRSAIVGALADNEQVVAVQVTEGPTSVKQSAGA